MFINDLIACLEELVEMDNRAASKLRDIRAVLCKFLAQAKCFHMGCPEDLIKTVPEVTWSYEELFTGDRADGVCLPYSTSYFDMQHKGMSVSNLKGLNIRGEEEILYHDKRAVLVIELESNLFFVYHFLHFEKIYEWIDYPVTSVIAMGGCTPEQQAAVRAFGVEMELGASAMSYVWDVPLGSMTNADILQEAHEVVIRNLALLNIYLMWLSCKNVEAITKKTPRAERRRLKRKGKAGIMEYHTLVLKPVGSREPAIPQDLWANRIHWCRGHFKTFKPDKPLFGKYTGRFYWQPALRGRNKEGMVIKDYSTDYEGERS